METLTNCSIRNELGSNACNRIRNRGHIPGVIYGHYFSNYPLEFEKREIERIIRHYGENAVINVVINGLTYPALVKEVQRDPVTDEIIHVDLQQVYATEKIHTLVPVLVSGKEKLGRDCIVQQQIQKVEVECYPTNVPKFISIDVSNLSVGSRMKISDVEFGEEISVLNDENEILLTISRADEQDIEEEEPDTEMEVEVIKNIRKVERKENEELEEREE